MRFLIDHGSIEIVQGDITDQDTEAIVNAANNHLWMGAGVAGAIKRKGGVEIEREAVAQGPVEVGQAVLTSGGALKARYVIHAAVMGQDLHTDAEKITSAMQSVLRLAEEKHMSSISFPALGTGIGGFSPFHCAKIMLTDTIGFLQRSNHLKHVRFVLFDKKIYDVFEEELKLQFSSKRHGDYL
ncbi:MAG: macro domain-containing protein [Ignavibacteriae bacterium]|nr:macro domain-containing protein [Ignavibacteriota bacterium]